MASVRLFVASWARRVAERLDPQPILPPRQESEPRFYVGFTAYDGDSGGDARRAWEHWVAYDIPPALRLEFWDGDARRSVKESA